MNTRQKKPFYIEIFVGILVIALGLYIYIEAQDFPILPGNDYGGELFPQIIGIMMVIGGAMVTLGALKTLFAEKDINQIMSDFKCSVKKINLWMGLPLGLVIFYIYLSEFLGGIETIFLMLIIMFLTLGIGILKVLFVSLITSLSVWVIFVYFLKVPLPLGSLIG